MYWGRGNLIPPFGRKLCPTQKGFGQFYVCVCMRERERERERALHALYLWEKCDLPLWFSTVTI